MAYLPSPCDCDKSYFASENKGKSQSPFYPFNTLLMAPLSFRVYFRTAQDADESFAWTCSHFLMIPEIRLSFFFSLSVLVKEFKMVSWCTLVCLLGVLTVTAAGENRLLLADESVGHTNIGVACAQTSPLFFTAPVTQTSLFGVQQRKLETSARRRPWTCWLSSEECFILRIRYVKVDFHCRVDFPSIMK